jgi:hypothetical protein
MSRAVKPWALSPTQDEQGPEAKGLADNEVMARIAKAAHQGRGPTRPKRESEILEGCTLGVLVGKDLLARQDEATTRDHNGNDCSLELPLSPQDK